MRLIDADTLKLKRGDFAITSNSEMNRFNRMFVDLFNKEINNAPTIDAVPVKHGYWKFSDLSEIAGRTWYECTCCGKLINIQYNYCPNCGAEMDEEVSDETN